LPHATVAVRFILAAMTLKIKSRRRAGRLSTLGLLGAVLCACNVSTTLLKPSGGAGDPVTSGLRTKITTIVVIYAENRAFDNL
jgi:phospholipase C